MWPFADKPEIPETPEVPEPPAPAESGDEAVYNLTIGEIAEHCLQSLILSGQNRDVANNYIPVEVTVKYACNLAYALDAEIKKRDGNN